MTGFSEEATQHSEDKRWTPLQLSVWGDLALFDDDRDVRGVKLSLFDVKFTEQYGSDADADVTGIVVCGQDNNIREMRGIAVGLVGVHPMRMRGISVGFLTGARDTVGIDLSVTGTISGDVRGVNIGGIATNVENMYGFQLSWLMNAATTVRGVQLGLLNYCEEMNGIQIGFVNIIRENTIPILPLVNARF